MPALEQVAEERAVALGVARAARRRSRGSRAGQEERQHRADALHAAERREPGLEPGALRLELARRRAASRSRRSTEMPAAVASGFPESVPAW